MSDPELSASGHFSKLNESKKLLAISPHQLPGFSINTELRNCFKSFLSSPLRTPAEFKRSSTDSGFLGFEIAFTALKFKLSLSERSLNPRSGTRPTRQRPRPKVSSVGCSTNSARNADQLAFCLFLNSRSRLATNVETSGSVNCVRKISINRANEASRLMVSPELFNEPGTSNIAGTKRNNDSPSVLRIRIASSILIPLFSLESLLKTPTEKCLLSAADKDSSDFSRTSLKIGTICGACIGSRFSTRT